MHEEQATSKNKREENREKNILPRRKETKGEGKLNFLGLECCGSYYSWRRLRGEGQSLEVKGMKWRKWENVKPVF